MNEELERLYREGGLKSVHKRIKGLDDPLEMMNAFNIFVNHLYWQAKDLDAVVEVAEAGIEWGGQKTKGMKKGDAAKILEITRALAYNLASFTWPGWDEQGIEVSERHLLAGMAAAKMGLKLGRALRQDDISLSRSHGMVASHFLAAGEFSKARNSFREAAALARSAGNNAEALLSEGFSALIQTFSSPNGPDAGKDLREIKKLLAKEKGGKAFLQQLDTAAAVFQK